MSELIRREDLENWLRTECASIDTYEDKEYVIGRLREDLPTVDLWNKVEDGLPEMSEIVPGYVCSEILVLYDAESKYADIGYVREKPDNNGVDWLWGKPRKNPTHWMYFKPPKEE